MRLDPLAALAAASVLLFGKVSAQTFTDCNPLNSKLTTNDTDPLNLHDD